MQPAVAAYFAALPEDKRLALAALRDVILRTLPGATEAIEYGMPSYRLGDILLGIAAKKQNLAFYCCEIDVIDPYRTRLAHLDCGKSCIRFRKPADLPLAVITDLLHDLARKHGVSG